MECSIVKSSLRIPTRRAFRYSIFHYASLIKGVQPVTSLSQVCVVLSISAICCTCKYAFPCTPNAGCLFQGYYFTARRSPRSLVSKKMVYFLVFSSEVMPGKGIFLRVILSAIIKNGLQIFKIFICLIRYQSITNYIKCSIHTLLIRPYLLKEPIT